MRITSSLVGLLVVIAACSRNDPAPVPPTHPAPTETTLATAPATSGSSTGGAPSTAPTELKIATWNLEWLDADLDSGTVKRKEEDYARLRKYADRLDADVVAFQEVEGAAAAARVFSPDRYGFHVATQDIPQRTGFAYKKTLTVTKNPDYVELDVGNVRAGADITVALGSSKLRLMSVHLKSGCFDDPLTSTKDACKKLNQQLPKLEAWIDARAIEGIPFAVLGDFNRRLFKRPDEPFWMEIDDANPPDTDLHSPTDGQTAQCWNSEFPHLIDHLVLSKSGTALVKPGSFTQQVYDAADAPKKSVLSDHCPLSVVLVSSGTQTGTPDAGTPPPPQTDAGTGVGGGSADAGTGLIKGNINSAGKKPYHLPNCPSYAATKIEPEKGERFFSTEDEAKAAGWVKAGNCP